MPFGGRPELNSDGLFASGFGADLNGIYLRESKGLVIPAKAEILSTRESKGLVIPAKAGIHFDLLRTCRKSQNGFQLSLE